MTGGADIAVNRVAEHLCMAENEDISPWQPYHMDRGFKQDDSAVTVVVVTGPTTREYRDTL